MSRKEVDFADVIDPLYRHTNSRAGGKGVLLTSIGGDGRSNVMTIGWATVGVVWGMPVMVVLVRPSRYTYEFVEESKSFTVNVPTPEMRDFVTLCGTRSGREVDKLAQVSVSMGKVIHAVTVDDCPVVSSARSCIGTTCSPRI